MHSRSRAAVALLAGLSVLQGACHDDGSVKVETTITVPVTVQGGNAGIWVTATPPSDSRLTAVIIECTGAFGIYDSFPVTSAGGVSLRRSYVIPLGAPNGTVSVVGRARTRSGDVSSQAGSFQVLDDEPPRLTFTAFPRLLHPNDTVVVNFGMSDNTRVLFGRLSFSGAFNGSDSIFVGAPGGLRAHGYVVPSNAAGPRVVVSGFAVDYLGNAIDSVLDTIPFAP